RIPQKRLPQADGSIDWLAIIQFAGSINRNSPVASILTSPTAICGKVLQSKTHRVEEFVATCTRLILAMQCLLVAHGQNFSRFASSIFQRWNVWWRFRRRSTEDIVEYPHTPLDW